MAWPRILGGWSVDATTDMRWQKNDYRKCISDPISLVMLVYFLFLLVVPLPGSCGILARKLK